MVPIDGPCRWSHHTQQYLVYEQVLQLRESLTETSCMTGLMSLDGDIIVGDIIAGDIVKSLIYFWVR